MGLLAVQALQVCSVSNVQRRGLCFSYEAVVSSNSGSSEGKGQKVKKLHWGIFTPLQVYAVVFQH